MHVICGFIGGVFICQFLTRLPNVNQIISIFLLVASSYCLLKKCHYYHLKNFLLAFSLGVIWFISYAYYVMNWTLDTALEGQKVTVVGYISSLPVIQTKYVRFEMKLAELNEKKCHSKIRLTWQNNWPTLHVGDKWRLLVKLKQPHGFLNPGGFDKEKQFLLNHLRAEGAVVASKNNVCLESLSYRYFLQRFRQYLQNKMSSLLKDSPFLGIILALTIGSTSEISQDQWQIFRNTGTNHLVAISGLHIGLVASLFAFLVKSIWRRFPSGILLCPVPKVEALGGLLMALLYSALAGFSVSTQRSLIMLLLWSIARVLSRQITFAWIFFLSMAIVVLVNPFAIFSMSFWLSYVAVACLLYGMSARLRSKNIWWTWGRPQWVVFIGMLPLSWLFFQQVSLISMFANVIAIPWVSFLVVPELLLGIVFSFCQPKLAQALFFLAEKLLALLWKFLQCLGTHQEYIWQFDISHPLIFVMLLAGVFILMLPNGIPGRIVSVVWLMPVFFYAPRSPMSNQFYFTVLDVGQGLAVVIKTSHHTLLYDTGMKLNDSYDMGKVVILPYLASRHVKTIDTLVISHGDNDHIGGAFSILRQMPVKTILTSVPQRFKNRQVCKCVAGMHWNWDGVNFVFLHPDEDWHTTSANNNSCVLKISSGKQSVLLTGDIEKSVENELSLKKAEELAANILVVPHHGSKTSSTSQFIDLVRPRYAVFSYGYLNRYHHPNQSVCKRYAKKQALLLDTVANGAISMTLNQDSDIVLLDCYRQSHRRFWHEG